MSAEVVAEEVPLPGSGGSKVVVSVGNDVGALTEELDVVISEVPFPVGPTILETIDEESRVMDAL